jgi:hypothetical protein
VRKNQLSKWYSFVGITEFRRHVKTRESQFSSYMNIQHTVGTQSTGWQRYFRNTFKASLSHLKNICLKFFCPKIILAVCRSINKNKNTHSSKGVLTGSFKSRDSLRTSRRTYHERDYELWKHKKSTVYDVEKNFEN